MSIKREKNIASDRLPIHKNFKTENSIARKDLELRILRYLQVQHSYTHKYVNTF